MLRKFRPPVSFFLHCFREMVILLILLWCLYAVMFCLNTLLLVIVLYCMLASATGTLIISHSSLAFRSPSDQRSNGGFIVRAPGFTPRARPCLGVATLRAQLALLMSWQHHQFFWIWASYSSFPIRITIQNSLCFASVTTANLMRCPHNPVSLHYYYKNWFYKEFVQLPSIAFDTIQHFV
jgi:hypothetical protein